jgi:hypothetical protein
MDIKPRPNHGRYLDILRRMTPAQRLEKSFELTEHARALFKSGLKRLHPELNDNELHHLYISRMRQIQNAKS